MWTTCWDLFLLKSYLWEVCLNHSWCPIYTRKNVRNTHSVEQQMKRNSCMLLTVLISSSVSAQTTTRHSWLHKLRNETVQSTHTVIYTMCIPFCRTYPRGAMERAKNSIQVVKHHHCTSINFFCKNCKLNRQIGIQIKSIQSYSQLR